MSASTGTTPPRTMAKVTRGAGTPASCAIVSVTSRMASIFPFTSVETRAAIWPAASIRALPSPRRAVSASCANVIGGEAGLGGGRGASTKHATTAPLMHDPCHSQS
eukprot:scaffold75164_cov33-Tisochrysis_lutea.AAC.3